MPYQVAPFETRFIDQLEKLPPLNWKSNAFDLFMYNDWQPWFKPYQVLDQQKLAGFGMLFHFDDVAWLGWLLVDKKYRKQGIGTTITQHLMDESKRLGATKLLLTATEPGAPIYEKLGFEINAWYHFFNIPTNYKPNFDKTKIRLATLADLVAISQLDFLATGEKRNALLESHLDATYVFCAEQIEGFYIETLGSGFVVASAPEAGEQLTSFRIKKKYNKVVVPDGNTPFIETLKANGFTETAKLPRMTLGIGPNWKPEMIFNRAAGYCG